MPSFLHGFSAPVKLRYAYSAQALANILLHEADGFLRWESAQRLMFEAMAEHMRGEEGVYHRALLHALRLLGASPPQDKALLAELLRMPAESELAAQIEPLDPMRAADARDALRLAIAQALTGPLSVWASWAPMELTADNQARRSLARLSLWYLGALDSPRLRKLALERAASPNMSLAMGGLSALRDTDSVERAAAMDDFHMRFRHEPLVLDKWFALEASSARPGAVDRVRALLDHADFVPNPNRIRAILGSFMRENLRGFHAADGSGYRVLAQAIARFDQANPQLAARLIDGLLGFRRLAEPYAAAMRATVQELATRTLSRDVREKLDKALASEGMLQG